MNLQVFNPLRWKKSFLVSILVAFVAIWFLFIDTYSVLTRIQLNQKKTDLIEQTRQIEEETAALNAKIENLENNPDLLEKIAREEYGMRKPGETVYIIKED
jgi:cell division protein FtsB